MKGASIFHELKRRRIDFVFFVKPKSEYNVVIYENMSS